DRSHAGASGQAPSTAEGSLAAEAAQVAVAVDGEDGAAGGGDDVDAVEGFEVEAGDAVAGDLLAADGVDGGAAEPGGAAVGEGGVDRLVREAAGIGAVED